MTRVLPLRLLPLTMAAVALVLLVKLVDVVRGGHEMARTFLITPVVAQQEESHPTEGALTPPTPPPAPDAAKQEEHAEPAKAADGEHAADGHGAPEEKAEGKPEKKADPMMGKVSEAPPPVEEGSGKGLSPGARYFSPIELEILNTLGRRRDQLDTWEKEVEVKENLLSTTEKRIDDKLAQVEAMRKDLQEMLVTYNQQEDAKIKSLVKIYESMKPRDAARIFDEVEMPILLLVIDRMAEKKAAPILASMDSKKAKQLTVELAEQRRLHNAKLANGRQAAAPVQTP